MFQDYSYPSVSTLFIPPLRRIFEANCFLTITLYIPVPLRFGTLCLGRAMSFHVLFVHFCPHHVYRTRNSTSICPLYSLGAAIALCFGWESKDFIFPHFSFLSAGLCILNFCTLSSCSEIKQHVSTQNQSKLKKDSMYKSSQTIF